MLLNARAIATTSQNSPAAGAAAAAAPAALAEALHMATLAACAADAAAKKESVSGHCPVPMWLESMLPYYHHTHRLSIALSSDPSDNQEQSLS